MSANGMVRPCSGPTSKRSWQGAPKTRSTPLVRCLLSIAGQGCASQQKRATHDRSASNPEPLFCARISASTSYGHWSAKAADGSSLRTVAYDINSGPQTVASGNSRSTETKQSHGSNETVAAKHPNNRKDSCSRIAVSCLPKER
jgi:hypothetical protein